MSETNDTRNTAPRCGDCGNTFASAAFGGRALFLVETLRAGARTAGWAQIAGRWKCSVCLAGITGPVYGPEREPVPSLPAPDSDPYRQYDAAWDDIEAGAAAFWEWANESHPKAEDRTRARIGDGFHAIAALLGGTPEKAEAIRREMWQMTDKYRPNMFTGAKSGRAS